MKPGLALLIPHFTLQLVAQSKLYDTHPQGGSVTFTKVHVTLPAVSLG